MARANGFAGALTRAAILIISTALVSGAALAGSAAADFGARRRVVEPKLTFGIDPALCESVLVSTRDVFDSKEFDLEPRPLTPAPSWAAAFEEPPPPGTLSDSRVGRLDLDLDGTGVKQVLIYRDVNFNWKGNWHYAYVFPNVAAFDSVRARVREQWYRVPDDQRVDPETPDLGGRLYYPQALPVGGGPIQTGDSWEDHELFEWRGRYYFFSGVTYWRRHFDLSTEVFRLHADGTVEKSCAVDVPDSENTSANFANLPAVASFLKLIRRIGAGGPDCGSLHAAFSHDEFARATELRAAIRPWVVSALNPALDYGRIQSFLVAWSEQELWNRREYQTLLQHTGPAQEAVAADLVARFGVAPEIARTRAEEVVRNLVDSRLRIPQEYNDYLPVTPLLHAIFERDRTAFDAAIAEIAGTVRGPSFKEAISAALSDSVEWQYGLEQLLREGADPNHPNDFGKTPLMVAAHMNRIDSARKLLKAGAHANLTTTGKRAECGAGGVVMPHTPLTYAAENASPVLMKLLADADSRPAGVWADQPLMLNPRLSAEQRVGGVVKLLAEIGKFRGPSFRCSNARTKTEKAICGSEVLRIFDAELARAYGQIRLEAGSDAADSQRRWLRDREVECSGLNGGDFADCLAETTRTRIRYLHNRLGEKTSG